MLEDITEYSLRMAREAGYDNVGTWEWIVGPTGEPFLMEVNTRIQVENGVSARIATIKGKGDVDLIAEQIRVGLGAPLGFSQKDISLGGVGIEYRIIAEDPDNKFAPWVGRITSFGWPQQEWLKLHSQVPTDREYEIPTDFDPNLALAIIWGKDLAEAKAVVLAARQVCDLPVAILMTFEPGGSLTGTPSATALRTSLPM